MPAIVFMVLRNVMYLKLSIQNIAIPDADAQCEQCQRGRSTEDGYRRQTRELYSRCSNVQRIYNVISCSVCKPAKML